MEVNQLDCCGMFELSNIGENEVFLDPEERYNPETGGYEYPPARTRRQALTACQQALRDTLSEIDPRGRGVFATTVAGMSIAEAALRSLHFRQVQRFRNGNTGNYIRLWFKVVR